MGHIQPLLSFYFFFLMIRRPPRSTLFPYTRSSDLATAQQRVDVAGLRLHQRAFGADRETRGESARHSRSEEHTSELQSRQYLVCRLLLEQKTMITKSSIDGSY